MLYIFCIYILPKKNQKLLGFYCNIEYIDGKHWNVSEHYTTQNPSEIYLQLQIMYIKSKHFSEISVPQNP